MEATYCLGNDIDVCRMFDQYLYKRSENEIPLSMPHNMTQHMYSSAEQTFHTPSFGDEEFDIPHIGSMHPVAQQPHQQPQQQHHHQHHHPHPHQSAPASSPYHHAQQVPMNNHPVEPSASPHQQHHHQQQQQPPPPPPQMCNSNGYHHYMSPPSQHPPTPSPNDHNIRSITPLSSVSSGYNSHQQSPSYTTMTPSSSQSSPMMLLQQQHQHQQQHHHSTQHHQPNHQQSQQQQQHYNMAPGGPPPAAAMRPYLQPSPQANSPTGSNSSMQTPSTPGSAGHGIHEPATTSDDSDDNAPHTTLITGLKRPSPEPIEHDLSKIQKKPKPTKKKKKRDPNEPQKPVSAYALFFRDTQAAIKGQNPNTSFGEVSKIVASMWDGLDVEHKNVYKKKTETAKKDYLKQLAAYRATLVSKQGNGGETDNNVYAAGYGGYAAACAGYNGYSPPAGLTSPPMPSPTAQLQQHHHQQQHTTNMNKKSTPMMMATNQDTSGRLSSSNGQHQHQQQQHQHQQTQSQPPQQQPTLMTASHMTQTSHLDHSSPHAQVSSAGPPSQLQRGPAQMNVTSYTTMHPQWPWCYRLGPNGHL